MRKLRLSVRVSLHNLPSCAKLRAEPLREHVCRGPRAWVRRLQHRLVDKGDNLCITALVRYFYRNARLLMLCTVEGCSGFLYTMSRSHVP